MNNDRNRTPPGRRRPVAPPTGETDHFVWGNLVDARDAFDTGSPTGIGVHRRPDGVSREPASALTPQPSVSRRSPERRATDRTVQAAGRLSGRPTRTTGVDNEDDLTGWDLSRYAGAPQSDVGRRDPSVRRRYSAATAGVARREREAEAPVLGDLPPTDEWLAPPLIARVRPRPRRGIWRVAVPIVASVPILWFLVVAFAGPTPEASSLTTDVGALIGPPGAPFVSVAPPEVDPEVVPEPEVVTDPAPTVAPTVLPPTRVPPTRVPPTAVPPTKAPATSVAPTKVPPTKAPPAPTPRATGPTREMNITAYCLTSRTSTGSAPSAGVAAAGSMVPIGTRFLVPGYGIAVVGDRNANYGPNELDVWFADCRRAVQWGRRILTVTPVE